MGRLASRIADWLRKLTGASASGYTAERGLLVVRPRPEAVIELTDVHADAGKRAAYGEVDPLVTATNPQRKLTRKCFGEILRIVERQSRPAGQRHIPGPRASVF